MHIRSKRSLHSPRPAPAGRCLSLPPPRGTPGGASYWKWGMNGLPTDAKFLFLNLAGVVDVKSYTAHAALVQHDVRTLCLDPVTATPMTATTNGI